MLPFTIFVGVHQRLVTWIQRDLFAGLETGGSAKRSGSYWTGVFREGAHFSPWRACVGAAIWQSPPGAR